MVHSQNVSSYVDIQSSWGPIWHNESKAGSLPNDCMTEASSSNVWVLELVMLILSSVLLSKCLPTTWKSRSASIPQKRADPPQLPYFLPIIGNLIAYLLDAAKLASSVT